jgi:SNF2 family DNA or RNA helicase
MSHRRLGIPPSDFEGSSTSDDYDDVELSDDGFRSPFKSIQDSVAAAGAAGISNAIVELSKDLASTKLDHDDVPIRRRKPPPGRNHPSLYDTSSNDDDDDDDDDDDENNHHSADTGKSISNANERQSRIKAPPSRGKSHPSSSYHSSSDDDDDLSVYESVSSSVEDFARAMVAPTPKKTFAFKREQQVQVDSTPAKNTNYLVPATVAATTSTKHPSQLRPQLGHRRRDSLSSSLGDDSSSAVTSSDDDDVVGSRKTETSLAAKKPTNPLDDVWAYDEHRKEYTMAVGTKDKSPPFSIPLELYDKLYDFQRDGVTWMARLHAGKIGGVLGKKSYSLILDDATSILHMGNPSLIFDFNFLSIR